MIHRPEIHSPGDYLVYKDKGMKLQQLLKNCLMRWKEISECDFCLLDSKNQLYMTTGIQAIPLKEEIELFRQSTEEYTANGNCFMYQVKGDADEAYILLVWGNEDTAIMTGRLAVCQIESLISACSRKSDRNLIMQDILLGKLESSEIYSQAKKLHISPAQRRTVFLIETSVASGEPVQETIRNIFGIHSRDFITPLGDTRLAVIHDLKDGEDQEDMQQVAELLVDMLNTEVMTKARVSYSNIGDDISKLNHSYKEADMAMEIGQIFYPDRNVSGYSHLGIGRLLYQLPLDVCELFIEEVLGADTLESLDEETLNIIRTFFENNLNLSETSRKLYVHRNTLVYRLDKIEKKYGLDIRTFEDALTLKLAMLVTDYIHAKKPGR